MGWSLPAVYPFVFVESRPVASCIWAVGTLVGLLPTMGSHVNLKIVAAAKGLPTHCTNMDLPIRG